jgi:DNA-directed RNA polymerase specialized sigma24 family protein
MTDRPDPEDLLRKSLDYQRIQNELVNARAVLQKAVVATYERGLSERAIAQMTGATISNITVHNWVRSASKELPGSVFRRLRDGDNPS